MSILLFKLNSSICKHNSIFTIKYLITLHRLKARQRNVRFERRVAASRHNQARISDTSESEIEVVNKQAKRMRKFLPRLHRPKFMKGKKIEKDSAEDKNKVGSIHH